MVDLSEAMWRKSSRSMNGNCVEVAFVDGQVAMRDSKHPTGPVLMFSQDEWKAFVAGLYDGKLKLAS
jgi:hypothetical protein